MIYIATIDGQTFEIEINTEGQVTLAGERIFVDFLEVAERAVYSLIVNGESFEAYIDQTERGWLVVLRGQQYEVDVEDERQRRLRLASGRDIAQSGEFQLKAPMPGLIISIPVEAGQSVAKGDDLVVLESMKMQNELKAPRDGVVSRVHVGAGGSVEQNQVLVTLE